ncbi:thylakoid membrane phosphoprotein 14 chloroplastic-like [Trifolium pratense]|uniref:Thylakoid membrane phosphoprotein 14 chloroplastic-like n=1 Tax=Trifolium pratense TaxID=57577 RepID=A0A2K3LHH0_TRIPR|nr:thylakoid membrane phosphoprotein 14 chloroplastic-like [Trifolium pratense]
MASSTSSSSFSITSTLIDGKLPCRQSSVSPQCVSLPTLPPPPVQSHTRTSPWKTTSFCRKIARNVMSMASSSTTTDQETTAAVVDEVAAASTEQLSVSDDSPEFLKTVQQAWEKVEDKYAVSTLAVAGTVALWGTAGVISAIDRLPLIPGVLEVVGIGYTGWFAYKNLVFKPDREALVQKIKDTVKEITGIDS